MIPITQTVIGETGNCLPAAVASVLECRLEEVPDVVNLHGAEWVEKLNDWLAPRGLFYLEARHTEVLWSYILEGAGVGYHLLGGPSSRGLDHVVVGYRGEVVHDPHPSRQGLTRITDVGLFVARLEVAQRATLLEGGSRALPGAGSRALEDGEGENLTSMWERHTCDNKPTPKCAACWALAYEPLNAYRSAIESLGGQLRKIKMHAEQLSLAVAIDAATGGYVSTRDPEFVAEQASAICDLTRHWTARQPGGSNV